MSWFSAATKPICERSGSPLTVRELADALGLYIWKFKATIPRGCSVKLEWHDDNTAEELVSIGPSESTLRGAMVIAASSYPTPSDTSGDAAKWMVYMCLPNGRRKHCSKATNFLSRPKGKERIYHCIPEQYSPGKFVLITCDGTEFLTLSVQP